MHSFIIMPYLKTTFFFTNEWNICTEYNIILKISHKKKKKIQGHLCNNFFLVLLAHTIREKILERKKHSCDSFNRTYILFMEI